MSQEQRRKKGDNERLPDPTPIEIWAATQMIQKNWTEEERLARRGAGPITRTEVRRRS
jgi:hypothetical protein